jgi:hypothetical protein
VIAVLALSASAASAAEPVLLHAAGSLRGALTELVRAFEPAGGIRVATIPPRGATRRLFSGALALPGGLEDLFHRAGPPCRFRGIERG